MGFSRTFTSLISKSRGIPASVKKRRSNATSFTLSVRVYTCQRLLSRPTPSYNTVCVCVCINSYNSKWLFFIKVRIYILNPILSDFFLFHFEFLSFILSFIANYSFSAHSFLEFYIIGPFHFILKIIQPSAHSASTFFIPSFFESQFNESINDQSQIDFISSFIENNPSQYQAHHDFVGLLMFFVLFLSTRWILLKSTQLLGLLQNNRNQA